MTLKTLFDRLLRREEKSAKATAKDRLRFVLMHDRADIPAPVMEDIRREILQVLSRHIEIDEETLEVNLECVDDTVALVANIPIRRVLTDRNA